MAGTNIIYVFYKVSRKTLDTNMYFENNFIPALATGSYFFFGFYGLWWFDMLDKLLYRYNHSIDS